jgi:MoaA/NifB/PqqE/SkfB family radical SAM enzyme
MKYNRSYLRLIHHLLHAYGQRLGLLHSAHPITLTFSVTSRCQSRCLTCHIGECYQRKQFRNKPDLSLAEIEKIFQSLGSVYFFNISGGEPFLREDLPQIVDLAVRYLTPAIIHIPTNALAPRRIEEICRQILETNRRHDVEIPLTVKPSIDGVGKLHDQIRGVPGNFAKLEETFVRLKILEEDFPEFHLELGTVISRYNVNHLRDIEAYVHQLGVQSYRSEFAEERAEFFNKGEGIGPQVEVYRKALDHFAAEIVRNLPDKRSLTRLTESLRLVYYDLAVQILESKTQVLPCYGGISNLHLNFDGELWPCCVLAYDRPLGSLRSLNYDIQKALDSVQARNVLKFIHQKGCHCPLANQWYSNILLHPPTLMKVLLKNLKMRQKSTSAKVHRV